MAKRWLAVFALLLALCLCMSGAAAEMNWPVLQSPGQETVKTLVTQVNALLSSQNQASVNSLFECYPSMMSLGITGADNAEVPEGVEITVALTSEDIDSLTLRMRDVSAFATVAGCFLTAVDPGQTLESSIALASARASKALSDPQDSFTDTVETLRGPTARAYFAYAPDEYHDGTNWITMTVIFPRAGVEDAAIETPAPTPVPTDGRDPADEE